MAYSTVLELKNNIQSNMYHGIADSVIDSRITEADKKIRTDLSSVIDFTEITDTPTGAPEVINILSQYKAAELFLVRMHGGKRDGEGVSDVEYWKRNYNLLIIKIQKGEIDVSDYSKGGTITAGNDVVEENTPVFGMGVDGIYNEDTFE